MADSPTISELLVIVREAHESDAGGIDPDGCETCAALDSLEDHLALSHQGHVIASHRMSWEDLLLMFRAMGGDEGTARMAERVRNLEKQLAQAERRADAAVAERQEWEAETHRLEDWARDELEAAQEEVRRLEEQLQSAQREADIQMGDKLAAQMTLKAVCDALNLPMVSLRDGWTESTPIILARIEEIVDEAERGFRERDGLKEQLQTAECDAALAREARDHANECEAEWRQKHADALEQLETLRDAATRLIEAEDADQEAIDTLMEVDNGDDAQDYQRRTRQAADEAFDALKALVSIPASRAGT
jgi:hypothetical protein